MLKKFLFLLIGICLISLTGSYTAPTYDDINFSLCSGYTAPTYNDINFTLSLSDACTCAGLNTNWEIDLADYCNITDCDLGYGNITFINEGVVLFNGTLEVYKIDFKDSVGESESYNLGSNFRGMVG